MFFEHKGLYSSKGEVPDGEIVDTLGSAKVLRTGGDATIVALAAMVPRAVAAADALARTGHRGDASIDVRSLVPLDTQTILREVSATGRLFTVEENPRLCGWGAELVSIVAEECFYYLDGPIAAHHHAAHSAPIGRRARGHGDPVDRAHRQHHREGNAVMTTVLNAEAIGAPTQLMIDGRWVDASDGRTFDVDDPATGEVIATVADASVEDGLAAVDRRVGGAARLGRDAAPAARRGAAPQPSSS